MFSSQLNQVFFHVSGTTAISPDRSASIAGFAPASPAAAIDDLGTILRVVGALA